MRGEKSVFWVVGRARGCFKFVLERSVDPDNDSLCQNADNFHYRSNYNLGSMNLGQVV